MEKSLSLNYFLLNKQRSVSPITLDLWEAERYDSAVVVQQLVGNLVYYSNQGRYEPRLAENWQRISPNKWLFNLKTGFVCENGEVINARSFKRSLEKSIFTLSKKGNVPIFSKLEGFNHFLENFEKGLTGIQAENNSLIFNFVEPVRSGLIQILSFAPFGYICKDNLNPDGSWKNNQKFISSGAYKVQELTLGKKYTLKKRTDWPLKNNKSPTLISITHELADKEYPSAPSMIDSFTGLDIPQKGFDHFPLVPEYINLVILGNLEKGFFSEKNNRQVFRDEINSNRYIVPDKWQNHTQVKTFYPTSEAKFLNSKTKADARISKQTADIIIEGKVPQQNTARWFSWQIVEASLKKLNLKYRFANNEAIWSETTNPKYDIRLRGPSVGAGVEAWGLNIIFCSPIGSRLPDPSGTVCKLINNYENDNVDDQQLSTKFLQTIEDDSAVIPVSRYGMQWYLSPGIKRESLSPLISVIRFDDLELD